MKAIRIISVVCVSLALIMVVTTTTARAQCCYFNPLLFPFAVAGAVVGTAAAITTGIVAGPAYAYPTYYGPGYYRSSYYGPRYYGPARAYYGPRPYPHRAVQINRHYNHYGAWDGRHWRR